MIRTESTRIDEAWEGPVDATVVDSFQNNIYLPLRIFGPAQFLRLLYGGNLGAEGFAKKPSNVTGWYWFAENDVVAIKSALEKDLKPFSVDRATYLNRMAFALRNEFRQKLAICRDWSPRFDFIARLTIPPQKSVVALVGIAKQQHVYSNRFPGYRAAIAPDTELSGGLKQYVLRLDMPANSDAIKSNWIRDDLNFNSLYR
jgi:hypothetical protein